MRIGSGWIKKDDEGRDYLSIVIDPPTGICLMAGAKLVGKIVAVEKRGEYSPDRAIEIWTPTEEGQRKPSRERPDDYPRGKGTQEAIPF